MKEAKGQIWMAGERMDIMLSAGYVQECERDIVPQLPFFIRRLCKILNRRNVARHLIQNIRIGDTLALVDNSSGLAFRLEIDIHAIRVLGIYEYHSYPKEPTQQAIYLLNNNLLWTVGRKAAA